MAVLNAALNVCIENAANLDSLKACSGLTSRRREDKRLSESRNKEQTQGRNDDRTANKCLSWSESPVLDLW